MIYPVTDMAVVLNCSRMENHSLWPSCPLFHPTNEMTPVRALGLQWLHKLLPLYWALLREGATADLALWKTLPFSGL